MAQVTHLVSLAPLEVFPWPKNYRITALENVILSIPAMLDNDRKIITDFIQADMGMEFINSQNNIEPYTHFIHMRLKPNLSVILTQAAHGFIMPENKDDFNPKQLRITQPPSSADEGHDFKTIPLTTTSYHAAREPFAWPMTFKITVLEETILGVINPVFGPEETIADLIQVEEEISIHLDERNPNGKVLILFLKPNQSVRIKKSYMGAVLPSPNGDLSPRPLRFTWMYP